MQDGGGQMFFHSWGSIGHVVVVSIVVYLFSIAALRIVGEQALAKMSGYDVKEGTPSRIASSRRVP